MGQCIKSFVHSFNMMTVRQLHQVLPSAVLDALKNNEPPKQNVLLAVKAFRENPASFSSIVDKRIDELNKKINALQREKDQLSNSDNIRRAIEETYATIYTPFRTIPRDILREIARHSSDTHPSPGRNQSPMNLTHVSSAWRSVVTNSPNLWTTLYLRIQKIDYDSLVQHMQVIQTWFQRAGSLPTQLFIYVHCKLGPKNNTSYNFRMFLKALSPWASRIRRLGIGGCYWVNLISNFVDIEWNLSNLVRLDFLGQLEDMPGALDDEMNELGSILDRITLFRAAKHLTTLVASQEMSFRPDSFAFLPWGQLQHLTLEEQQSSGPDFFALLQQCPQLQTASLRWFEYGMLPPGTDPYSVTKLEKLQLVGVMLVSVFNELARFFSKATFPALTHLHISIADVLVEPEDFMSQLDPISVFPSLQFFSLTEGTWLPIHLILGFIRKMPRLQTFNMEISGAPGDERYMDFNKLCESLTINGGHCEYLPLLEECTFYKSYDIEIFDVALIAQFIQSRTQDLPYNFSSLKRLTLLGGFGFITDLGEEVVRLSSATSTAEISINSCPRFRDASYGDPLGLRSIPFQSTDKGSVHDYTVVVNHF